MDLSGVAGDGHALTVLSSPVTRWPNRISRQELKKSHIDEDREPVCHTYACSSPLSFLIFVVNLKWRRVTWEEGISMEELSCLWPAMSEKIIIDDCCGTLTISKVGLALYKEVS